MMTGLVQDQHLEKQIEKQMGCMSGFLQLFDRQQVLAGKRVHSHKRLTGGIVNAASPEPLKFVESPAVVSKEFLKSPVTPAKSGVVVQASPERFQPSPVPELRASSPGNVTVMPETPPKSPLPLPIFELKEGTKSSWKFCKEAPRLSLDSRAVVDAKGSLCPREIRTDNHSPGDGDDKQRRSPSVIARLMGLEQLPPNSSPEPLKKPELRRSASESRVSRDLFQSRFIDGNNFQVKLPNQSNNGVRGENFTTKRAVPNVKQADPMEYSSRNVKSDSPRTSPWRSPQQRRSFFDSTDFFPEPKPTAVPMYGDFEKRLKMRGGIDDQSKDLETLKQILEALQLKGLLHSKKPSSNRDGHRNFVIDRSFTYDESKIVLMKPWRSPGTNAGVRGNLNHESVSPRRERTGGIDRKISPIRVRNSSSPNRIESNLKTPNSIVKRKPLSIETHRRISDSSPEPRRVSPINSPKLSSKQSITSRSPRTKKPSDLLYSKTGAAVTEDESSSISESTVSTSSQTDTERSKMEEYREGRSLLERCDKLLHSIAEMNATESQPSYSNSVIPSPVSVLDSAFDKDDSSSPSPVLKRSIDFKDVAEDEAWNSPEKTTAKPEEFISDDPDFIYISEILRAYQQLYSPAEDSGTVFSFLEKQQQRFKKETSSKVTKLHRKLVFDVAVEISQQNSQLPPWILASSPPSLKQVWTEFERIREREASEDLLELICGVLRKDLVAGNNNGWGDQPPVETSEAVLDIERAIFKDLVSETIRDLAEFAAGKSKMFAPRRKLVF